MVYLSFGAAPRGDILRAIGARYSLAAIMKAPADNFPTIQLRTADSIFR